MHRTLCVYKMLWLNSSLSSDVLHSSYKLGELSHWLCHAHGEQWFLRLLGGGQKFLTEIVYYPTEKYSRFPHCGQDECLVTLHLCLSSTRGITFLHLLLHLTPAVSCSRRCGFRLKKFLRVLMTTRTVDLLRTHELSRFPPWVKTLEKPWWWQRSKHCYL